MHLYLYCDGGSRGNPGPAAAGALLRDTTTGNTWRLRAYLGKATNNEAEYSAVLLALRKAQELKATQVSLRVDSKLVVEQISGRWRIKDPRMQRAVTSAHTLLHTFTRWDIQHIPREHNTEADALVNAALDARSQAQ